MQAFPVLNLVLRGWLKMVEIMLLYFCLHVFHIDQKRVHVFFRGLLSQVILVNHLIASIF